MIARIWRGPVPAARKTDYIAYMEETGLADYAATPGNLGVHMLARDLGEEVEFAMLTFWDSMDAIRAFAGEDVDKARYYPRDREFLTRFDERVEHFEVIRSIQPPAPAGGEDSVRPRP